MSFPLWLTLLGTCVVISLTPGAGAINTMGNALNVGMRRAVWGVLGQQVALVVHLVIVALGVGVLVAGSPVAFEVIRYAGAAYLVYLGIRQFLARPEPLADLDEATAAGLVAPGAVAGIGSPRTESAWSMARRGLWVNLLNPKSIVFFLAFLPQFIRPAEPLVPQYLVVGVTIVAVDVAVMWGVFAFAARSFRRLTRSVRGQRVVNRVFGSLFLAVGVALATVH